MKIFKVVHHLKKAKKDMSASRGLQPLVHSSRQPRKWRVTLSCLPQTEWFQVAQGLKTHKGQSGLHLGLQTLVHLSTLLKPPVCSQPHPSLTFPHVANKYTERHRLPFRSYSHKIHLHATQPSQPGLKSGHFTVTAGLSSESRLRPAAPSTRW